MPASRLRATALAALCARPANHAAAEVGRRRTVPAAEAGWRTAAAALAGVTLLAALLLVIGATAPTPARADDQPRDSKASASVIGGHDATIAQYPSLAYIEGAQATTGFACTGTVVAPRVVLTAGHCVEDIESSSIVQPDLIAVATGVSNLRRIPPAQISRVEKVLAYPDFNPFQLHGDAGLLILSAPVASQPIALATAADAALYEPGQELTIAGWGIDNRSNGHAPEQLQAASVPIQEANRCKEGTRRFYPFYDPTRQLCGLDAPNLDITTCNGDSGGPAIATRADGSLVEVGITSLGDGTCNPSTPAVYTRVDQISSWVQSWIDAVESSGPTPSVRVPKAHLPLLSREHSEELSALAMGQAFGARFADGQKQTIDCARVAKARLRCGVSWTRDPNDYFGQITVFYAIRHNVVLAGVHYAIHWVNDRCDVRGDHLKACEIHTARR